MLQVCLLIIRKFHGNISPIEPQYYFPYKKIVITNLSAAPLKLMVHIVKLSSKAGGICQDIIPLKILFLAWVEGRPTKNFPDIRRRNASSIICKRFVAQNIIKLGTSFIPSMTDNRTLSLATLPSLV